MRRRLLGAMLVLLLGVSSGCTDYHNINSLAFALGLALDRTEDGDLRVTLQFPLPGLMKGGGKGGGGGGGKGSEPFFLVVGEGATFPTALENAQQRLSRPLAFGHLQTVLISEELARSGMDELMEQLWRFPQVDKLSHLVIVSGNEAAEVLKVVPPQERLPALYLNTAMATVERTRTQTYPATLIDALVYRQENGRDLLSAAASVEGDRIVLDRIAIFQKMRLVDILSPDQSRALLIAMGDATNFPLTLKADGRAWVIRKARVIRDSARVERRAGGYTLRLTLRLEGEIGGMEGVGVHIEHNDLQALQRAASEEVRRMVTEVIQHLQEERVDPVGFFSRTYGALDSDEHWRDAFQQARLEVQVSTRLSRKGTMD